MWREKYRENFSVVLSETVVLYNNKSLVDPASNHMLVSKTKPCMSKSKLCLTRRDRGRLIKSVVVQMGQFILLG